MIQSRRCVPGYYAKSRDYQVFLSLLDIILNSCYSDTEYFTSLISPTHCKARILPLLSNYVGYTYDYAESVKLNRVITKNWATLKRNRGGITGFRMAIALAMSQLEDLQNDDIFKLFNVWIENTRDEYGREIPKVKIYLYHSTYLSKLYDLIEAVRPAGTEVEIIQALPISSAETVVLTDDFRLMGYDYKTGKLIRIGDVPIYIENCWEIMRNNNPTGEYLVDNEFYDSYHNPLNLALDSRQRIINTLTGEFTGEIIRAPYIYQVVNGVENENEALRYLDENNNLKFLVPTGKYFNLEHAAKVLNTCYEIRVGGKSTGYFVSADSWKIIDDTQSRVQFYLKDYMLNNTLVKKVYGIENEVKYNWHVNLETGYFVQDTDGSPINSGNDTVPWDEHAYLTKKRFVMNTSPSGIMYTTDYFVNKHEDIQDSAGNIILSKKDRYQVSDSAHIGFSEVHNMDRPTTYDKTWIYARSRTYGDDKDFYNSAADDDFNDYSTDSGYIDNRIAILKSDIRITHVTREYDGTNNIGEISVEAGGRLDENNPRRVKIPIETMLGEESYFDNCYIEIGVNLKPDDNFFSVFSNVRLTYETDSVGTNKHIYMDWKLAETANQNYNTFDLPERIIFSNMGTILPKTLKFISSVGGTEEPIIISPKVYDGTTEVSTNAIIMNPNPGGGSR